MGIAFNVGNLGANKVFGKAWRCDAIPRQKLCRYGSGNCRFSVKVVLVFGNVNLRSKRAYMRHENANKRPKVIDMMSNSASLYPKIASLELLSANLR